MPTFTNPATNAVAAREAARGLAHTTRAVDDPTEVYAVLGAISSTLASMAQSLHQLGDFHDGRSRKRVSVSGDRQAGRTAAYKASWELHRAAEMLHQVAAAVDRAHEIEANITYDVGNRPALTSAPGPAHQPGLSL